MLVTGMSGTGKSTTLNHLAHRGYSVVDTDYGDWIENLSLPDGIGAEPHWREDRIDALLTRHEDSGVPLFLAGTVINQEVFYPRFAEIVLLTAPLPVILTRITTRTTNPFGKTPEERAQIESDTAEIEPLLRAGATIEIDTRRSITQVVDQLVALVGFPSAPASCCE
ncbi:AAA family ATPase [Nocardia suismassiliense]|uniref:AAA family ATPase n=1 Tax=Nocardia suismassiliense TaxID=2077092 RepID=UPI0038994EAB